MAVIKKNTETGVTETTAAGKTPINVITNKITVRSIDRSKKDVKTLRSGLRNAESVEHPNRTMLYNVYEDITLDAHLSGIVNKRNDSVLNKKLLFKVGETTQPVMMKLIQKKVFRDVITEYMLSKGWGTRGVEFDLTSKEMCFTKIPVKHIDPVRKVIKLNENDTTGGIPYEGLNNVLVLGEPDDLGYYLKCGFYALLKKGAISDWAQYIELFGSPVMIMTYESGDVQTELELDKVLEEAGNSMRLKLPKQAGFEMKDGKASNGDGELHNKFNAYMDAQMSIAVLGNTETTTSSKSSGFAQSKTHAKQQLEITKSDMLDVLELLNSEAFMNILRAYGLPVEGGNFEYDKEIDIEYLAAKSAIDKTLIKDIGVPASKKYLWETYAIDEPADEEDTLEPQPEKPESGTPPPPPETADLSDDDKPVTIKEVRAMLSQELKDFFA